MRCKRCLFKIHRVYDGREISVNNGAEKVKTDAHIVVECLQRGQVRIDPITGECNKEVLRNDNE